MKIQLLKMKAELKVLATEIRTLKSKRKESQFGYVPGLDLSRRSFRVKHLAYCMLRGRKLEEIEPKLRDGMNYINQTVRQDAARIVSEVLNPKPPVQEQQPVEVKKESLWIKVLSSLS